MFSTEFCGVDAGIGLSHYGGHKGSRQFGDLRRWILTTTPATDCSIAGVSDFSSPSGLQHDEFHLPDKAGCVVFWKSCVDVEAGVAKAADVHDVLAVCLFHLG
ncbi:hypothetical protein [Stieleria maiorica]|uniref:hypothetical protein n=1 Tax=Stieleria maiorica TaxID=2795974 RepID=UPI0011CBC8E7|nr:hypothetical protein [Stieleria maiorica]